MQMHQQSVADGQLRIIIQNYQRPPSNITPVRCLHDKDWQAILINILPLGALLTTLIVFILITFHKNLKVTKVYDNCTKSNALHTYLVELRTGDASVTYNKRKTTLIIDMFDENQSTLARIAIPGSVIFGRRESPVRPIDDDKYSELRVTKFWLYRATRLKKVVTIRITHTCMEAEAKLMVYGLQIRSSEKDRPKLFFPVMNYISAYGAAGRPNASFDYEVTGSISNMGGNHSDASSVSEKLSWVDYTLMFLLYTSLVYFSSSFPSFSPKADFIEADYDATKASLTGLEVGAICFVPVLAIGLLFRYIIKHYYSLAIGIGPWAVVYYSSCIIVVCISLGLWIWATYWGFKHICSNWFVMWILLIGLALILGSIFFLVILLVSYIVGRYTEQYLSPEDFANYQVVPEPPPSKGRSQQHVRNNKSQPNAPTWAPPTPVTDVTPVRYALPQGGPYAAAYGQHMMVHPVAGYKAPNYYDPVNLPHPVGYVPAQPVVNQPPQLTAPPQQPATYQQAINPSPQPSKPLRKVGSTESTGSTYYQQLMKNKGGVKSISQYGELLKQKRQNTKEKR